MEDKKFLEEKLSFTLHARKEAETQILWLVNGDVARLSQLIKKYGEEIEKIGSILDKLELLENCDECDGNDDE